MKTIEQWFPLVPVYYAVQGGLWICWLNSSVYTMWMKPAMYGTDKDFFFWEEPLALK